jgi:hypothetical protein
MRHLSIYRSAVSVGFVLAAWHAAWVVLVGLGWASVVVNFILKLHFIRLDLQIAPYSGTTAFLLIALAFASGAFLGGLFALVWNSMAVPARESELSANDRHAEALHGR